MDENQNSLATIPYFAHEGDMNRLERVNKRQFILILILILALVGSNLAWTIYESQFEDTVITQSGEADGSGTVLLNNDGEINYGYESDTND